MKTTTEPILPARQLNEFVYCPRLFYLEFVEGIFVHNADTLQGAAQHKRVDKGNGKLLAKDKESDEDLHSRSVALFSESLGVTLKMDLVEGKSNDTGDMVYSPIEYKKGSPKEDDDGRNLWDTDKIQLGLQIMLLRENGYPCEEGIIYYRETRQRVRFELDDETEQWIYDQIREARATAQAGQRPPPLEDSPKCPRCSLVSVCLPDETRMLREAADERHLPGSDQLTLDLPIPLDDNLQRNPFADYPEVRLPRLKAGEDVRRLIAPDHDTRALYLNTPGTFLGKKGELLVAKEKGKPIGEFRLKDIHHAALFGPVQVSSGVIQALCEKDIPIAHFTLGGWFYGMTRGHALKNVFTRIEQFHHANDPVLALQIARLMVHGKIKNQRTLLMRNHVEPPRDVLRELKHATSAALHATSHASLLGIEGAAGRLYFGAFNGMLKPKYSEDSTTDEESSPAQLQFSFDFTKRNRRPPKDPVNALLSLGYALLSRDCTIAAWSVGFDPYVGMYHQPRFGRPALALDFMEEFRPLIADSTALNLVNNNVLKESDFVFAGDSVSLTPAGRKVFFKAYEKRIHSPVTHPVFGYQVSYRRAIELQCRLLAKYLTGEIEQYVPFTTR